MFYDGLTLVCVITVVIMLLLAVKLLWRRGWLLGWLRGMVGLIMVVVALLLLLLVQDLTSYREVLSEKSIATLSFERIATQAYRAVLVDAAGKEQRFELKGDQWQLDARILKWPGVLASFKIKPAYRLDRLSGRYYSLEKERQSKRTVYELEQSDYGVDLWQWLQSTGLNFSFVDASLGSASFVPMEDGVLYEVALADSGLLARPLNERAKAAVKRWQ